MTYQAFFKLKDTPFRLTPDVDYFFPSESHGAALETMLYSIQSGEAFVQITGQPGVGKTILVRHLLNQLEGEIKTALILHPRLSGDELLKAILEDLGAPADVFQGKSKEGLLRYFRDQLLEAAQKGCTTVVIIDEAQEIPNDTLEELRLLSNLETEKKKLLSIILVGQPELEQKLSNPALRQLHQRITIRYRIDPFSVNETQAYITHRLSIAGAAGNIHFSDRVLQAIHRKSAGIPRQINVICERALMAACVEGVKTIKSIHLKRAVESYLGTVPGFNWRRLGLGVVSAVLVLFALGAGWWTYSSGYRFAVSANGGSIQAPSSSPLPQTAAPDAAVKSEQPSGTESPAPAVPPPAEPKVAEKVAEAKIAAPPIDMVVKDWRCLVLNRLKGQGEVWQGDEKALSMVASFELAADGLDDGVYLLGEDKDKRPFLFNHHQFAPWDRFQELAGRLWGQFGADSAFPVIPLLVMSGKGENNHDALAEDAGKIRALVKDWAAAWRSLDLDTYIQYYGPTHFSYQATRNEPTILTRDQYYNQIGRTFQNSGHIALQLSEPVCIIDPANPKTAVAIFFQRYSSARWVDEGIKVLFLRQMKENEDAEFTWKIEGRCWLPVPLDSKGKV